MFRIIAIVAISLFISGAAFAHDDDWGRRHHHHHHHGHGFNSYYYRNYLPPVMGYYPAPMQYHLPPPVRYYPYAPQMPRHEYRHRDRW